MSYQAGIDRDQAVLFPMTIEELIPQEHLVWIIDLFIQNTDLKKLGFSDTFFRRLINIFGFHEFIKRLQKLFSLSCSPVCTCGVNIVDIIFSWYSAIQSRIANKKLISFGFCTNCCYVQLLSFVASDIVT